MTDHYLARTTLHRANASDALDAAAQIMADETSWFIQPHYGREGLEALVAAGWMIVPPEGDNDDPQA